MWVSKIPFFSCEDAKERLNFTVAIAECLNPRIYGKSEVLVSSGDAAESMFIIAKGVVAQSSGIVLCPGRFFGEDMLLRNGAYPHTYNSVTFVTVNVLAKGELFDTLATGKFPGTWRSLRRWIVRRAFQRVVKTLVNMRRATPGYKRLSGEEFENERDRLIKIGRAGNHTGWADQAPEKAPGAVSSDEMVQALELVADGTGLAKGNKTYIQQVQHSAEDSRPGASPNVPDEIRAELNALRDEMRSGFSELRSSMEMLASVVRNPAQRHVAHGIDIDDAEFDPLKFEI